MTQKSLGNQDEIPDELKSEKALNKYYMLPFLLGILGMFYQYKKGREGKQDFWVIMLLFFMTGLAIIIFMNQVIFCMGKCCIPFCTAMVVPVLSSHIDRYDNEANTRCD